MLADAGQSLDAVVVLTVDKEEVVQRLLKRAQDEGRSDDTEEVMRHRQDVYAEQTAPLIEVYDERGLLVEVDGMGAVDDVTARVFDALEETNGASRVLHRVPRPRRRDQDACPDRDHAGRRPGGRRDPGAAARRGPAPG